MKKLIVVFLAALMVLSFGPLNQAFAQGKVVRITLIDRERLRRRRLGTADRPG